VTIYFPILKINIEIIPKLDYICYSINNIAIRSAQLFYCTVLKFHEKKPTQFILVVPFHIYMIKTSSVPMNKNALFMFLFLMIGIALLLSLSLSTNAQASSGSAPGGGSGSVTDVTQMGICVVGVESPCNGVK
jgi:hypothetical protein